MSAEDDARLAVLENEARHIRETVDRIEETLNQKLLDHENRLRGLESSDRKWAVVAMAGSVVVGVVLHFLMP